MSSSDFLTIAVAKGYLLEESIRLFSAAGVEFDEDVPSSRKLFTWSRDKKLRFLQVRPWDVPAYVANGAADLGIVGRDVLLEQQPAVLNLLDLKFGVCRLVLAGMAEFVGKPLTHNLRIATKYPQATANYFHSKGLKIAILKLYGAIELAPLTGLSDLICDLVATGKTLQDHDLHVVDTLFTSSAYLVANPVCYKLYHKSVMEWVSRLNAQLG